MSHQSKPLFIALGNEYRSDDGIGIAVMAKMKSISKDSFEFVHHNGDPTDLIDLWSNRDVTLVDALYAQDYACGVITIIDPLANNSLTPSKPTSSHALSVQEALSFGEILGKMPRTIRIYAVAGENFAPGTHMSRPVEKAVNPCVETIMMNHRETGEDHA